MEYLGLWVRRDGVIPINRKIEAITNMKPPTYRKEVQNFIGVINYYRNMWPRGSYTLASLTRFSSIKRKYKWTQVKQDAFNEIKKIVDRDTLLGSVIVQKGKPITFYSRKLTDAQQWYTAMER